LSSRTNGSGLVRSIKAKIEGGGHFAGFLFAENCPPIAALRRETPGRRGINFYAQFIPTERRAIIGIEKF